MKNIQILSTAFILISALFNSSNISAQWSQSATAIYPTTLSKNVGIGTSTPNSALQVNGTAYVNTDVIVRKFLYVGDDATNNGTFDIRFGSNGQGTGEGIGSKRTAGGNQNGLDFYTSNQSRLSILSNGNVSIKRQLNVGDNTNNGIVDIGFAGATGEGIGSKRTAGGNQYGLDLFTGFQSRLSIANTGNVGIGTTTPGFKLTVQTATNSLGIVHTDGNIKLATYVGGAGNGGYLGTQSNHALYFFTNNGGAQMSLQTSGKVGIGISDPAKMPGSYKLYVADGILTEKVKVALKTTGDWADYVFSDNYKLRSLTEVEQYVQENKHLPGVPSAEDVQKTGIDIATMDAKLLEKIEELTLYVIDIKKENDALKARINTLESDKH